MQLHPAFLFFIFLIGSGGWDLGIYTGEASSVLTDPWFSPETVSLQKSVLPCHCGSQGMGSLPHKVTLPVHHHAGACECVLCFGVLRCSLVDAQEMFDVFYYTLKIHLMSGQRAAMNALNCLAGLSVHFRELKLSLAADYQGWWICPADLVLQREYRQAGDR